MKSIFTSVYGYAVPFNQIEKCGYRREFFASAAFDAMLSRPHQVFLNFGDHGEAPLCRDLSLFTDDYGLGFMASVRTETWRLIKPRVMSGDWYASINCVAESHKFVRDEEGLVHKIHAAEIDHITITATPVYSGTGVWPADADIDQMPRHLGRLANRWQAGRGAAHQRKLQQRADQQTRTHRRAVFAVAKPKCPASVYACLARAGML